MMKALSVIELAELYRMNRQSIYKRINKGDLSKNSDGKIDLAEAIRVFGEPSNKNNNVTTVQSTTVQKETEVDMLKQQVDILKKQLAGVLKLSLIKNNTNQEKGALSKWNKTLADWGILVKSYSFQPILAETRKSFCELRGKW